MTDKHYLVDWKIDVWAATPREAAVKAREAQLRPDTLATVFVVKEVGSGDAVTIDTEDD